MASLIWLGLCALVAVLGLGTAVVAFVAALSVAGLLIELFFRLLIALAGAVHWIAMGVCRLITWPARTIITTIRKRVTHAR